MAENQDGQEKSQEPTAKRLADARKKGQVPRSRELNTMAVTLVGMTSLYVLAGHFADGLEKLLRDNLSLERSDIFDPKAGIHHLITAIQDGVWMVAPFFAITAVVAVLASIALGGLNVSFESMKPKLSKLDPIKGIGRMFSAKSLMELLKAIAKFFLITGVTILLIRYWEQELLLLADMDVSVALYESMQLLAWSAILLAFTLVILAVADVPFQLWDNKRQLKMTEQEVKDEFKQTEGNPEMKGRIRQMQREIANRRMIEEVPKADVVVTNPTHFAVALRYDQKTMRAPILVAKGADLIASNIRRVAGDSKVPIVEAPALARAVFYSTDLQEPIPAGLYMAVAQLLAYVFQLRVYYREGGAQPTAPTDYPVPEDLRHD